LTQQLDEQMDAIKKIGVAKQCNMHKELAMAPILSKLTLEESDINFIEDMFIMFIIKRLSKLSSNFIENLVSNSK
jgi:hypothetical protein